MDACFRFILILVFTSISVSFFSSYGNYSHLPPRTRDPGTTPTPLLPKEVLERWSALEKRSGV